MSVLVVGSLGLDTLETPFGHVEDVLGGSASYFSLAAGIYERVQLVAVAGDDFPRGHRDLFQSKGIDLAGFQTVPGKTFRWGGKYHFDMNSRDTLFTDLGVFADFHPSLPESFRTSDFVFLANIHPSLQLEVLDQVARPKLVALDSMNLWIETARDDLVAAIRRADLVTINDSEARQFSGTPNLLQAARRIMELGPRAVVIKKGEHGAMLIWPDGVFFAPAYPLETVVDPTGAGDSFAGGFLGYLASTGDLSYPNIKRAMIHGSVVASFSVEAFGPERLTTLNQNEISERYGLFQALTAFEAHTPPA
jgi:sugar/nucleoside kinase (ribokinase family)